MGIMIDVIIIAIIALSTFLAYRKGLISLAVKLFAFIIAIVVTSILYQPITNFVINTTGIDEAIENAILEKTSEIMIEQSEEKPEIANQLIDDAKNNILPETARNLAINIVRGIVLIVLIIAIRIALNFVTALANIIAKLPILNQINKAGGIVYGVFRGIIIVYAILLLVNFAGQLNINNTLYKSVNQSSIGKSMSQNNILLVFFK